MIRLAGAFAWLSPGEERTEYVRLATDLMDAGTVGYAEVGLVCSLNADHSLDGTRARAPRATRAAWPMPRSSPAWAIATRTRKWCGYWRAPTSVTWRSRRPTFATGPHHQSRAELRQVAAGISRISSSAAQVRAIDTLGLMHIEDREILKELENAFATARSVNVQRAIAEVFIRSDAHAIAKPELAAVLREHRLPSGHGEDLIDVLLRRLQS